MTKSQTVVCSFHTRDEYYSAHARRLKRQLADLGLISAIRPIEKKQGQDWADVCRQKIPFIAEICQEYPDSRIFWTDVDCQILTLPDQLSSFSADIIGFQRGFRSPLTIGYQNRTRFWEPCFWGVNATDGGRRFISDAAAVERSFSGKATDDYFFEESWRANCASLSFQIIPSNKMTRDATAPGTSFFVFGASGNVDDFKDKVLQHTKPGAGRALSKRQKAARIIHQAGTALVPKILLPTARKLAQRSGLTAFIMDAEDNVGGNRNRRMDAAIKSNSVSQLRRTLAEIESSQSFTPAERAKLHTARAIEEYLSVAGDAPLPIAWWLPPAPGNFGDWLTPYIFRAMFDRPIRYVNPQKPIADPHIFSIGSIGKFIKPSSFVIGTGISRGDVELQPAATYRLLRGPITGRQLVKSGGKDPGHYGDPGLIMSRLFRPEHVERKGRIALVRHYTHQKLALVLPPIMDELSVLMSSAAEIETFIWRLTAYDHVITSAMHVFIVCQSYGISAALVTFEGAEGAVHGDGTKYEDFFLGADLRPSAPSVLPLDLSTIDLLSVGYDGRVSAEKLDDLYDQIRTSTLEFSEILSPARRAAS